MADLKEEVADKLAKHSQHRQWAQEVGRRHVSSDQALTVTTDSSNQQHTAAVHDVFLKYAPTF